MSNIEENKLVDRDQLREEIRSEINKSARQKIVRRLIGGLVLLLVLIALPIVSLLFLGAKTGLVEVPLLSNWFYKPVSASETVIPLLGSSADTVLDSVIARAEYDPVVGLMTLSISEVELTTLVNTALTDPENNQKLAEVESAQISVNPNRIEMFVYLAHDDQPIPALLEMKPIIENNSLKLVAERFVFGSLSIPKIIAGYITETVGKQLDTSFKSVMGDEVILREVKLLNDRIIFKISRP